MLKESDGAPERYAVHYGLLRSLKQAIYTPEPEGHYALASDDYCHFTSPIRRYPDLQVHRQLAALLAKKKPKSDPDELVVLGEHCTRTEKRAEAAERELIKVKLLTHLETRIGEEFHAVIIGVEDFGFFCQLVELPVDGLVHVTSLSDDFYYLEADTHTLIGRRSGRRYRLGDKIEVRVARVDIDRRQLDLMLLAAEDDPEHHLPSSRTRTRPSPGPKPSAPRRGARSAGPQAETGSADATGSQPSGAGPLGSVARSNRPTPLRGLHRSRRSLRQRSPAVRRKDRTRARGGVDAAVERRTTTTKPRRDPRRIVQESDEPAGNEGETIDMGMSESSPVS